MTILTNHHDAIDATTLAAANHLAGHPDFKVLRRISDTKSLANSPLDDGPTRIAVLIDTETTGLDVARDVIIELATQRIRFDAAGRIVQVGEPRVWRQDPGRPLPDLITQITGLNDTDLAGQSIDAVAATALLQSADVVIAHNARFDAPFVEKRLPDAAGLAWACTLHDIDWRSAGFDGRTLSHLVMEAGWFFEAHRAEADIAALLHLLAHPLVGPAGNVLAELVCRAATPTVRLDACQSAFKVAPLSACNIDPLFALRSVLSR